MENNLKIKTKNSYDVDFFDILKEMIAKDASKSKEVVLTELYIHKILYFLYGIYFAKTKKEIFIPKFEAWKYGPVEINYRYNFKENIGFILNFEKNEDEEIAKVILEKLLLIDVWDLVKLSHETDPWIIASEKKNVHSEIDNEEIKGISLKTSTKENSSNNHIEDEVFSLKKEKFGLILFAIIISLTLILLFAGLISLLICIWNFTIENEKNKFYIKISFLFFGFLIWFLTSLTTCLILYISFKNNETIKKNSKEINNNSNEIEELERQTNKLLNEISSESNEQIIFEELKEYFNSTLSTSDEEEEYKKHIKNNFKNNFKNIKF